MKPPSILLIDDDDEWVKFAEKALASCMNPLQVFTNAQEALDFLQDETSALPMIILLDLYMPKMDGFQFLEKLQKIPSIQETLVFILSSSNRDMDKMKGYGLNIAGYIEKPLTTDHLLSTIGLYTQWVIVPPNTKLLETV